MNADELAAAIADGAGVDWAELETAASSEAERGRVRRFALLARVAGVHAAAADATGIPAAHAAAELAAGDTWGNLRVIERLGAGTFGTVYRAHDAALARDVALKLLRLPAADPALAADALAEGRLLARVRHPNVVAVYGADHHHGVVGIWMELIEGQTLEEELQRCGPLKETATLAIGGALASALAAVHQAGVLHRDVKTDNVMREARGGRIVLMDFSAGRECVRGAAGDGPWPATLAGSPPYLAPELLQGRPASEQSDLYALGVCLLRLATGRFPFEAASFAELAEAHRAMGGRNPVSAPRTTLDRIVARLLEADPARRPAAAHQMLRELTTPRPSWVHVSRQRRYATVTRACALAVAVTGVSMAGIGWGRTTITELAASSRLSSPMLPVATTSDAARDLYDRAQQRLIEVWDWHIDDKRSALVEVMRLTDEALELDPGFASAWVLKARAIEARCSVWPPNERTPCRNGASTAQAAAERALGLVSRVGPAEQAAIEGYLHRIRGNLEPHRRDELRAAAQAFEAVRRTVPLDYWAVVELERLYVRLQQPHAASRLAIEAVDAHTGSSRLAAAAINVHLATRNRQALRTVATRALAHARAEEFRVPRSELAMRQIPLWEARDAWLDGDVQRVLAILRRLSVTYRDIPEVRFEIATGYESLGRFDDARAMAATVRRPDFKLALADARQERWQALATRLRPHGVASADALKRFNYMYIWAGWLDDAERLLEMYRTGEAPSTWQLRQEFEATLRTAQGRGQEALTAFAPILVDEELPRVRMHEFVARARLQVGDASGAATVLERIHRDRMSAVEHGAGGYDWLRATVLLAEVYRDTGRRNDAARLADDARRHLVVADADNPFAARLARLP